MLVVRGRGTHRASPRPRLGTRGAGAPPALSPLVQGLAAAALCAAAIGCAPELDDRLSLVDRPRVLAIAATPAEQAPAKQVSFELLFAAPGGEPAPGFEWALCVERKPLSESGSVDPECLQPEGAALVQLGGGASVAGTIPADACRVFGPDPPEATAEEPAGRAADPDASGGYYQPVRVRVAGEGGGEYVTGAVRIACGLPGATPQEAIEMTRRYRPNARPALRSLSIVRGGVEEEVGPDEDGQGPAAAVKPGETVTWRAAWDACPTEPACGDGVCGIDEDAAGCAQDCAEPAGCAGAEQYVFFDPEAREVRERREAIRISWFATGGAFAFDRTGRGEDEADQPSAENEWTAPEEEGTVTLWAVIRDDRGGTGWQRYRVRVAP